MQRKTLFLTCVLLLLLAFSATLTSAIGEDTSEPPAAIAGEAIIINDEGGPVVITGDVTYTNPFFTLGVAQPLVILEDQAGFIDRNEYFLLPPQSQVLGQITSDFYRSPFSYSLSLPIEPQGSLRDVDNDGVNDTGVMVFAVAYWTNTFGDPFLEERDLYGGGWSTAYASTRISTNPDMLKEIIGGEFLIYAPDDQQGFPSGFGPDGMLFTADDPIVSVPQGYSVVNLDVEPFTFDRSRAIEIDLIEPDSAAVDDFSDLSYVDAFDAMVDKLSKEYAFTEYRNLNWDELASTYRPRVQTAQAQNDAQAFALVIRDLLWEIPDGHVGMSLDLIFPLFVEQTEGGIGIAIRELDDGRVIINYLLPNGPAEQAGIQLGAEIIAVDGQPIAERLEDVFIWATQALGTDHTLRLQQLRYATRFPMSQATTEVTYRNPGGEEQTTTMQIVPERQSFNFSSFNADISGIELPVEYEILPSGYGYVAIYSFSDDEFLTVQLWERMIRDFKDAEVPGIIIDMRNNGGGSGFLSTQMAAYFHQEPYVIGNTGSYLEEFGDFYFDERGERRFYLPPPEQRYDGPLAVLVAPSCFSACEFFSYAVAFDGRAEVVGHYPTGGLGGSVEQFYMPENITITFTQGRAVDPNGEIHIEGKGVAPTVRVPVTAEAVLNTEDDILLQAAERALTELIRGQIVRGGSLAFGDSLGTLTSTARIEPGQAVQFTVELPADTIVSLYAGDISNTLDTVMRVYDSTGQTLLLDNDDANNSPNSALEGLTVGSNPLTIIVEVAVKDDQPASEFFVRVQATNAE